MAHAKAVPSSTGLSYWRWESVESASSSLQVSRLRGWTSSASLLRFFLLVCRHCVSGWYGAEDAARVRVMSAKSNPAGVVDAPFASLFQTVAPGRRATDQQ